MTEPSTELAVRQETGLVKRTINREMTDSWIEVVQEVGKLASFIAETEFVPRDLRGNAPAVAAVILNGRELGLPPMRALSETHVIEGRTSMSARIVRAMVYDAGHELEFVDSSSVRCEVRGRRAGQERWTNVVWTIDQARLITGKRGPLINKDNWRNYPRRMLQARATSEICDMIFPDVLNGMGVSEVTADEVDVDESAEVEQPKTTVSRAPRRRTAPTTTTVTQLPTPPAARPESEPEPLEVDIDIPASPTGPPAGPARVETPGPAVEDHTQTDAEVIAQAAAEAPERDQPATVHELRPEDQPRVTASQLKMLGATWSRLGVTKDEDRREMTATLAGRELAGGTTKDLTRTEASALIDTLGRLANSDELDDLIVQVLSERGGE